MIAHRKEKANGNRTPRRRSASGPDAYANPNAHSGAEAAQADFAGLMSVPHLAMWLIVLVVAAPAAFRNPTAGALGLSWIASEIYWLATGLNVSLSVAFCADIGVLAVICAKAIHREGCRTYPDLRTQLSCFWRALTLPDKLIAGGFIFAAWPIYVCTLHPWYAYWALSFIFIAQLLCAGGEALLSLLGDTSRRVQPPPGGHGLAYAAGRGDGP